MTVPVLSLLRRYRNILLSTLALAIVFSVATPSVRARVSAAVLGQISVPNLDHAPAMLDPAAFKPDGQLSNNLSKRPAMTGIGTEALVADGIQGRSASSAASRLKGEALEDVDEAATPDIPRETDGKDVAALLSHGINGGNGLAGIPSPISGRSGNGAFGGGAGNGVGGGSGTPGGFSSGLRSDFDHGLPLEEPRTIAENVIAGQVANSNGLTSTTVVNGSASTTVVVTQSARFDPNTPFGTSDLTKIATNAADGPEQAVSEGQRLAAAPLATPEPGTLLLVANGVAAALGSRFLRRRRVR